MVNNKTAVNADFKVVLGAIQVAKKMQEIVDAAHKEADQLRDDFISVQDFHPLITESDIFMHTRKFLHLFDEFDVKSRPGTEYPYKIFVVIDGVTIHSIASEEDLLKAGSEVTINED